MSAYTVYGGKNWKKSELYKDAGNEFSFDENGTRWSRWHLANLPVANEEEWFQRSEISLSDLPTNTGGVYQVGVMLHKANNSGGNNNATTNQHIAVLYLGRAQKVNKHTKGTSLRQRLIYEYQKKGHDLANALRPFLSANFCVYFRWCTLSKSVVSTEAALLQLFDFPFNADGNTPARPTLEILRYNKHGDLVPLVSEDAVLVTAEEEDGLNDIVDRISSLTLSQKKRLQQMNLI